MNKKNIANHFYSFIFITWYSTEMIFSTTLKEIFGLSVNTINSMFNWLIFALLMFQIIFLQSYKKKELMIIISITLPISIATVLSGKKILLSAWMFIVASKNTSFDKIVHTAYKILLITIPMVIFWRLAGFIEDYTMIRGNVPRFSLGFSHPNQLGLRVFQLTLCHCYVNRTKLGILNYCYIILAVIFTIVFPHSQTAYISLIVFIILLLVCQYIKNRELFAKSLVIGALLLNVLSIILSFIDVHKSNILSQIDRWMSARFSLSHRVWSIYGVSFWGQRVYVTEEERKLVGIIGRLWLDNAYVSILLRYGILVFLITAFAYLSLLKSMAIRKEYILVIILFLYALYGLMENGLFMLSHNIFLLVFADLLYKKTEIMESAPTDVKEMQKQDI